MSDKIIERVHDAFREKRLLREAEKRRRLEEICEKIPGYKELEDQRTDVAIGALRQSLLSPLSDEDIEDNKRKLAEITERQRMLLEKYGSSPDYLEPPYDCDICKDTGVNGNGYCACFKQAVANAYTEHYRLSEILKKENFSNFSFEGYSDKIVVGRSGKTQLDLAADAVTCATDLIETINNSPCNMLILGSTGSGKTFLSHCITAAALERGHTCLYLSAPDFFEIQRDREFLHKETAMTSLTEDCELLVIDDLGSEIQSSFVSSALFRTLNSRFAKGQSTVISTNLDMKHIQALYSERITSRLIQSFRFIQLESADHRTQGI